jgi:hypothetical protein
LLLLVMMMVVVMVVMALVSMLGPTRGKELTMQPTVHLARQRHRPLHQARPGPPLPFEKDS